MVHSVIQTLEKLMGYNSTDVKIIKFIYIIFYFKMICYQGRCVNQAAVNVTFNNKNCNPNPCLHGGQCIPNSLNSNFTCNCTAGYSGTYNGLALVAIN